MRSVVFVGLLFLSFAVNGQVISSKKGDISNGSKLIVEMEKYEGSAEVRPKFRLLNMQKDTLLFVKFNKDFAYDWMTFNFKEQKKIVEVNSGEIIKGLNYQKNLGSFLVDHNIFDTSGNINTEALEKFAAKYNEDLTRKYKALNEDNRVVAATKFDYRCDDNSIHVNGRHVGYVVVPANQQTNFSGIQFKDMNNKVLVSGDLGPFGGTLNGADGKQIKLGMPGKTTDCGSTMGFVTSILRELFRNGYYRS